MKLKTIVSGTVLCATMILNSAAVLAAQNTADSAPGSIPASAEKTQQNRNTNPETDSVTIPDDTVTGIAKNSDSRYVQENPLKESLEKFKRYRLTVSGFDLSIYDIAKYNPDFLPGYNPSANHTPVSLRVKSDKTPKTVAVFETVILSFAS